MGGYNHIFVTTILYYIYTIHLLDPYYNGLTILYFIISIYTMDSSYGFSVTGPSHHTVCQASTPTAGKPVRSAK